jgi:hypothetical protein
MHTTWRAGVNARFHGRSMDFIKSQLGAFLAPSGLPEAPHASAENSAIPDSFDARTAWSHPRPHRVLTAAGPSARPSPRSATRALAVPAGRSAPLRRFPTAFALPPTPSTSSRSLRRTSSPAAAPAASAATAATPPPLGRSSRAAASCPRRRTPTRSRRASTT